MKFLFVISFLLAASFGQAQKAKKPLPDSAQIKNTITSFYKWYNTNWQKVKAFKLYKGKTKKDAPPYEINWIEVEKYFAYLHKNVPYLSEAFFEEERKRFKRIEKDFKDNPDEEMPSGFDYDHFTNSQEEPSYFMSELLKKDNNWLITFLSGGKAHLTVLYKEGDVFFSAI
jgi:hypothetical protein